MTVTAFETIARSKLKSVIDTEFAPEGFTADNDRLHESLGRKGTRIGISPTRSRPIPKDNNVLAAEILVQFYGTWKERIDPEQKVDPIIIETYAERFRRALRTGDPDQANVWYFQLISVEYPEDPTGNKTRFEAIVIAMGNNPSLVETTG